MLQRRSGYRENVAEDNRIGDFLRARRELVHPEQLGLPVSPRRRVRGLRREELAALAGVSVDYYVRLEQGRERNPSVPVCDALAAALLLDADLTAHLHALARPAPARRAHDGVETVPPGIVRLAHAIAAGPAFVHGRQLDVLVANELAQALHPAFTPGANLARAQFLDPSAPAFFLEWESGARSTVASLRRAVGEDPHDERLSELVGELSVLSPDFAALWARHDVVEKTSGPAPVQHPLVGEIELTYDVLSVNGRHGQVLMTFLAEPGSRSAHALERLASLTLVP